MATSSDSTESNSPQSQNTAPLQRPTKPTTGIDWKPEYSRWRHGGWYVPNARYPSGAVGCVSRNYPDGKWRIVCDNRNPQPTYATRDDAAFAERELIGVAVARASGGAS